MATHEIKLTGWKAIAVIIVIIGLLGWRLFSQEDLSENADLISKIEMELTTEYLPGQVEQMKAAQEAGDDKRLEELAKKITSTKLNIHSLEASRPMFDFSSPRDVILKVEYSLDEGSSTGDTQIGYYLFEHYAMGDRWRYIHRSTKIGYYLNFM